MRLFLIMMALMPGLASAANLFEPVAEDKAMQILAAMFGKLGVFGASSSDAFAEVMLILNGAVLTIGGILVAYTILAGTIGTAHDGEMLGKKFSSIWIPIRTVLGTAAVLPVFGGYCVMQFLVGWAIVQGIGLADGVWSTYMKSSNVAKQVTVSIDSPDVKAMAWKTFGSLACTRIYEKIYQDAKATGSGVMWPTMTFGVTGSSGNYSFGAASEAMGFTKNTCGTLKVDQVGLLTQHAQASQQTATSPTNFLMNIDKVNSAITSAQATQIAATDELISKLDSVARNFANNLSVSSAESSVNAAAAAYQSRVKDAASGIVSQLADFQALEQSSTKDGWILGGAWFMRMTYLMDVANQVMGKTPSASGANTPVASIFKDEYASKYLRAVSELKSKVDDVGDFGVGDSIGQTEANGTSGGWFSDIKSFVSKLTDPSEWLKSIFKGSFNLALKADDHPVMTLKNIGNSLVVAGGAMYFAYSGTITALATSQGTGIGFALSTLPIAMIIFPAIMGIGFTLSYVLPMMPFMIWIGVSVGWIVLCVEALIAAPMWAVMHLTASGDDMTGSGSQGYKLLLSLLLRPVLMIFGLIAAIVIITVFGKLLNFVFADVFMLSQQNSNIFIWLLSFIAGPLIYLGLQWQLFMKALSVIHVIPDQLLTWFGGGGGQLGSYGESMGGRNATTYAAAAAIGSMGGRGMDAKQNLARFQAQAKEIEKTAKVAEQSQLANNIKVAQDSNIGPDGAALVQKGLEEMGEKPDLSSLDGQRLTKSFAGALDSLGGEDSSQGQAFKESMSADIDRGASYSEAFANNIKKSLDEKFGSGAGEFVSKQSDGKFSGSSFTGAIEQLSKVQEHYGKISQDPDEIASKSMSLINAAQKGFESSPQSKLNGGDKGISTFVGQAIAKSAEKNSMGSSEKPTATGEE